MDLGTFSISLAVEDLDASKTFYGHFGFEVVGGDAAQNWLILRNGSCTIGLFQGMFDGNILTFNPGWDGAAQKLDAFTDRITVIPGATKCHPHENTSRAPGGAT